ncbi:hypothetical protein ACIBKX_33015 [Streptomyces sp. NPDC050658]|uniref:hypothetical protein n=1 Tax=unclassified Streptomyces TaxID=2593676 RepID=UPI00343EB87E
MTKTSSPPWDIAALDVPAAEVAAEAACLVLRQAATKTHSESDRIAYALDVTLLTHPDAPVSTNESYPGWDAHIATLAEGNRKSRRAL